MESSFKKDFSDKKNLEKYSSAFTLSDMEIFIFPELFYPLILADIMSPELWRWRDDPWFNDIEKKGFTVKANRIKQYIIQNYVFNLDLSTWGLHRRALKLEGLAIFSIWICLNNPMPSLGMKETNTILILTSENILVSISTIQI